MRPYKGAYCTEESSDSRTDSSKLPGSSASRLETRSCTYYLPARSAHAARLTFNCGKQSRRPARLRCTPHTRKEGFRGPEGTRGRGRQGAHFAHTESRLRHDEENLLFGWLGGT